MLRSSDHSAVTYTTDDLVLFRESPFAAWMERLTLENPDHGIIPDTDAAPTPSHTESVADIVATLRAEGRNVTVIADDIEDSERAANTNAAMRAGADFIVDAYLAEGLIAATAGLMMRTSGFSDLGDYLYIPCEARPLDLRHSSFRLCVLADLLQSAQGQLPPQMLIISGGADLTPLQTEDHIYYYRSVKANFLASMAEFRKHRMPDPAESTFFGRWSACAGEVLKQRAQRDLAPEGDEEAASQGDDLQRGQEPEEEPVIIEEIVVELPKVQVAGGAPQSFYSSDQDTPRADATGRSEEVVVATLAEQASMLTPGSFHSDFVPGHTPNLARIAPLRAVAKPAEHAKPAAAPEPAVTAGLTDTAEPNEAAEPNAAAEPSEAAELAETAAHTEAAEPEPGISNRTTVDRSDVPGENWVEARTRLAQTSEADALKSAEAGLPHVDTPATRRTSDIALENLEFIGSGPATLMGPEPLIDVTGAFASMQEAQPPEATLGSRESFDPESPWPEPEMVRARTRAVLPDLEPPEPVLLPPDPVLSDATLLDDETLLEHDPELPRKAHPLDSQTSERPAAEPAVNSMIDMDSAPPPSLSPVPVRRGDSSDAAQTRGTETTGGVGDSLACSVEQSGQSDRLPADSPLRQFSNSLQTGNDFEDLD